MNGEAFLPTIGHSSGPSCILLVYGFTEHEGNLLWLIIIFSAGSSLPHPHDLLVVHRAQLGSHSVRNEPIIWWRKREETLWSRHLYPGYCFNRLWEVRDFLLIFWWPRQSVSAAHNYIQQIGKQFAFLYQGTFPSPFTHLIHKLSRYWIQTGKFDSDTFLNLCKI